MSALSNGTQTPDFWDFVGIFTQIIGVKAGVIVAGFSSLKYLFLARNDDHDQPTALLISIVNCKWVMFGKKSIGSLCWKK